jgi:hypothetical protein
MEAVDGVGYTKLGLVQRLNLLGIAQIGLASDYVAGALGGFGLDNVDEDQVNIGGSSVFEELSSELQSGLCLGHGLQSATHDTSEPASGTGDQDDVLVDSSGHGGDCREGGGSRQGVGEGKGELG